MTLPRLRWLFAGSAALNLFLAGIAIAALAPAHDAGRPAHERHGGHRHAGLVSVDPSTGVVTLPLLRVDG